MDDAAIYKLEFDGRIVGKFGAAGNRSRNSASSTLWIAVGERSLLGELSNWRVQKVTLHPAVAR